MQYAACANEHAVGKKDHIIVIVIIAVIVTSSSLILLLFEVRPLQVRVFDFT